MEARDVGYLGAMMELSVNRSRLMANVLLDGKGIEANLEQTA